MFRTTALLPILLIGTLQAQPTPSPQPAGLVDVYRQAVENNADLAAAQAQYRARREIEPQARSGLLPQISIGAAIGQSGTQLDKPKATYNRSGQSYQATLSQPLFRADRWFQLKAAQSISEQARLEFSSTQQTLILRTAEIYFAILRAQDNLAATLAEEAAFKHQRDQAQERHKIGLADRTDLLQTQAAYDVAQTSTLSARQMVDNSFQALTTLTDRTYYAVQGVHHNLPILLPQPNQSSAWASTAAQQNLMLQASSHAREAAQKTLQQSKAGFAPTVDAVVRYQRGDNDAMGYSNPSPFYYPYGSDIEQRSIGIEVKIPLYTGGMLSSKVREASQGVIQAEQGQESLRRQVVQNTLNLHRAVNTDVSRVKALHQTVLSSYSAVYATEIGYQVGTRNVVDVLQAQRLLYDSVRDYNNARYDYILDNLRLKQAAGTLSPDDLESLQAHLNPNYRPDRDFLPPDLKKQISSRRR